MQNSKNITTSNKTDCINPATGEIIGHSEIHSVEDLQQIIKNAKQVWESWKNLPVKERVKKIKKIRDFIVNNADRLAEIISRDNGKTRTEAMATEVLPASMGISYYCKNAKKFLKDEKVRGGNIALINKRSKIARTPFGVVGIISPWNYPFGIPFPEIIMALLAGNTVVFKAASETQKVGLAIKECIESAELPEGVFNYVNMPGRIAGDVFLETGIDKLFFTGSVPVGKYLMGKAAETLTPITLELGGNDAMIVCDDADIDRASSGAVWAGFQNSGQSCGGVERIYVHENIYESFLEKLKSKVQKLKVGYDQDYTIEMGAMTATRQIDVVHKHVEEAVSKGAIVFAKSNIPDDKSLQNFIPAIVLTGVDHSMLVMKEETFGPVVTVMKVKNNEEAIMLANDSDLGLTGSVWSKNSRKAFKIAKQIQAGSVTINDHLMSHGLAETAWGGFKESGIGRSHGKLGFDEMTQPQYIVNDILPFVKKNLWWPPYNQKVYAGIKGVMDMQYATSFGQRLKGIFNLLKIVMRMFKKD